MLNTDICQVDAHMFLSIICLVFGFPVFSIIGLIYSLKTNNLVKLNALDQAFNTAESARMWDILSILCNVFILVIGFVIMISM